MTHPPATWYSPLQGLLPLLKSKRATDNQVPRKPTLPWFIPLTTYNHELATTGKKNNSLYVTRCLPFQLPMSVLFQSPMFVALLLQLPSGACCINPDPPSLLKFSVFSCGSSSQRSPGCPPCGAAFTVGDVSSTRRPHAILKANG